MFRRFLGRISAETCLKTDYLLEYCSQHASFGMLSFSLPDKTFQPTLFTYQFQLQIKFSYRQNMF